MAAIACQATGRLAMALTSAAKVTVRRPNTLVIDIAVDDPKAYTAPWTVTLTQPLMVDSELMASGRPSLRCSVDASCYASPSA